jgi:hypothetical protein
MKIIKSTEPGSEQFYVGVVKNNNDVKKHDVYIELGGHTIPAGREAFAAFTPQDCFEIINAIATEAGLLEPNSDGNRLTVKKPKPPKSKETLRREELMVEYFSSFDVSEGGEAAIDRIIELEKKLGEL